MKSTVSSAFLFGAVLLSSAQVLAAVPDVVTYAGVLRQGTAPANGTFSAIFDLFDADTAGTKVFTQVEGSLAVSEGELVVDLGSDPTAPLSDALLAGGPLFLQITVNGEVLEPRAAFTSVPFARRAAVAELAESAQFADAADVCGDADTLQGQSIAQILGAVTAGAGLVKTGNTFALADNGVSSASIVDRTIQGADIKIGGVGSTEVLDNSLTQNDLGAASVGQGELIDGAVNGAKIADLSVGNVDLAPNAVTGAKVLDGTITSADLSSNAVTSGNINAGIRLVLAPKGCGSALLIKGTVTSCKTQVCTVHRNQYLTNDEDVAPTFADCDGSCGGFTDPRTCSVSQTAVGVIVQP